MVLVRGLDRLPGTSHEDLSDADWAIHTAFMQSEFETEGKRREAAGMPPISFQEFAAPFADRPFNRHLEEQVLELRKQAEALRRIANETTAQPEDNDDEEPDDDEEEHDDPSLVSNIDEMTFDAGRLDREYVPRRNRDRAQRQHSAGRHSRPLVVAALGAGLCMVLAWVYAPE